MCCNNLASSNIMCQRTHITPCDVTKSLAKEKPIQNIELSPGSASFRNAWNLQSSEFQLGTCHDRPPRSYSCASHHQTSKWQRHLCHTCPPGTSGPGFPGGSHPPETFLPKQSFFQCPGSLSTQAAWCSAPASHSAAAQPPHPSALGPSTPKASLNKWDQMLKPVLLVMQENH